MQLRLTDPALADLSSIEEYTRDNWGEQQAELYLTQLEHRMLSLLETPYLGRPRPEISMGCRSLVEGKHLILYRIDDDIVSILGIPHASMDIDRQEN